MNTILYYIFFIIIQSANTSQIDSNETIDRKLFSHRNVQGNTTMMAILTKGGSSNHLLLYEKAGNSWQLQTKTEIQNGTSIKTAKVQDGTLIVVTKAFSSVKYPVVYHLNDNNRLRHIQTLPSAFLLDCAVWHSKDEVILATLSESLSIIYAWKGSYFDVIQFIDIKKAWKVILFEIETMLFIGFGNKPFSKTFVELWKFSRMEMLFRLMQKFANNGVVDMKFFSTTIEHFIIIAYIDECSMIYKYEYKFVPFQKINIAGLIKWNTEPALIAKTRENDLVYEYDGWRYEKVKSRKLPKYSNHDQIADFERLSMKWSQAIIHEMGSALNLKFYGELENKLKLKNINAVTTLDKTIIERVLLYDFSDFNSGSHYSKITKDITRLNIMSDNIYSKLRALQSAFVNTVTKRDLLKSPHLNINEVELSANNAAIVHNIEIERINWNLSTLNEVNLKKISVSKAFVTNLFGNTDVDRLKNVLTLNSNQSITGLFSIKELKAKTVKYLNGSKIANFVDAGSGNWYFPDTDLILDNANITKLIIHKRLNNIMVDDGELQVLKKSNESGVKLEGKTFSNVELLHPANLRGHIAKPNSKTKNPVIVIKKPIKLQGDVTIIGTVTIENSAAADDVIIKA